MDEEKNEICEVLDFAMEKVTKYRDIMPQAETLSKLRTGKVRREKTRSRYIPGQGRVLSHKHVNEGLKRLKEMEEERLNRQRVMEYRKRIAEEKKAAKESLEKQWKTDLQYHNDVVIPEWEAACAEINREWLELTGGSRGYGKKPPHPAKPKRPLKPKVGAGDLSIIPEGGQEQVRASINEGEEEEEEEEAELVHSLRAFEISHFGKVSTLDSARAVSPSCMPLP